MAFYNFYFTSKSESASHLHGQVTLSGPNPIESYFDILKVPSYNPYPFSLTMASIDHTNVSAPYCFTVFTYDYVLNIAMNEDEIALFNEFTLPHYHNHNQLIYVLSGNYTPYIEQEQHSYATNDVCFLKPETLRSEDFSRDYSIITASLPAEYLTRILRDKKSILNTFIQKDCIDFIFSSPYHTFDFTKDLRWYYAQAIELMLYPAFANDTVIEVYMSKLFVSLINYPEYKVNSYQFDKNADFLIFKEITEILQATYGRITRCKLEEKLHYSGGYLNKLIQRYTNLNFSQYKNTFTMARVAYLLEETNLTTCEICDELSIQNRTHFYKQFKEKYGKTPNEYRKSIHN